jgi:hypothetical protein
MKLLRLIVFFIYAAAFAIVIFHVLLIPQSVWAIGGIELILTLGFSLLVGFCGVALAYFVYVDGEDIEDLHSRLDRLKSYCKYCGAENKTDAVLCEKCGKQLE